MQHLTERRNEFIMDNQIKVLPPWERPAFLILITLIGGYMNAYTYITRNEILANMHTANMSHFGISLALGRWETALTYFLPILACILGAAFSELMKKIITSSSLSGDWRKAALLLEALALFAAGLMPPSFNDILVTVYISFFMGYQLCLFRKCLGVAHNTTICTGNLRNVGQVLYQALSSRCSSDWMKVLTFASLTFSFAIGAIPGTLLSLLLGTKAVWLCSLLLLAQAWYMRQYEKRHDA